MAEQYFARSREQWRKSINLLFWGKVKFFVFEKISKISKINALFFFYLMIKFFSRKKRKN
jgi:hypothetical protein